MSSSLVWRPQSKDRDLGYQLKFALAPHLWGHDGSLTSPWTEVGHDLIPFLRGVAAASNDEVRKEAEKLIGLIEKHDTLEIRLVN